MFWMRDDVGNGYNGHLYTSPPVFVAVSWSIIQIREIVKSYMLHEESVKTDSSTSKKPCGTSLAGPVGRLASGDCKRSCQTLIRVAVDVVVSIVRWKSTIEIIGSEYKSN